MVVGLGTLQEAKGTGVDITRREEVIATTKQYR